MRNVLFVFMVWVFPILVVGTLVALTVMRRRRTEQGPTPGGPPDRG